VVVLSGNDDPGSRARALAEGAKGYLVKLPPKAELIACIREQASRSAGGSATLDLTVIDGFRDAGAPDFTRRLIDQFIREASAIVRALQEAAVRADAKALNAGAHSLKGSSMIMGASRLAVLCAQIEEQVAAARVGEVVTPALMAEIDQELVRVQHALEVQREAIGQR
jgi:HPt (histidine-containing phosphotransfer) domain-containing protein